MKIVIATPLYPPDIAEPAPYVKELATRLEGMHAVTILTYGRLPEQIDGVHIIAVNKRLPLFFRLTRFMFALHKLAAKAEVLFVENGLSTELPALLVSFTSNARVVVHYGDRRASTHEKEHSFHQLIGTMLRKRASAVIDDIPLSKPEIIPTQPRPIDAIKKYEDSWVKHISLLKKNFSHEQ